jgi:autotransporter-associated beta strand protein
VDLLLAWGANVTINGLNSDPNALCPGRCDVTTGGTVAGGGGTLTVGDNNANGDYSGIMGVGGSVPQFLVKIGTGTQILRNVTQMGGSSNTVVPVIQISGGVLRVELNDPGIWSHFGTAGLPGSAVSGSNLVTIAASDASKIHVGATLRTVGAGTLGGTGIAAGAIIGVIPPTAQDPTHATVALRGNASATGNLLYCSDGGSGLSESISSSDTGDYSARAKLVISGGVLGLGAYGDFLWPTGDQAGSINFQGSGGFAAYEAPRTVSLGLLSVISGSGSLNGSLENLQWNSNNFVPNGSALIFGNPDADNTITFTNPIDLNGQSQTIQAVKGTTSLASAIMTGALTNGGIIKTGNGTLTLAATNTYAGSTTVTGGALKMLGSAAWNPALVGPGTTDIQHGRAVFDYSGGDPDPAAAVNAALTASHASGFASGQIHSSTATSHIGLGWADDTVAKQVTVLSTYYGDANLDGVVNAIDFNAVATNFGKSGQTWSQGNFDYDAAGNVNTADFTLLAQNFGATPIVLASALGSLVPEPGSMALLATGILGFSVRRRRC